MSPLQVRHLPPVWDLLLPLAQTPDRRDHRLLVSLPKDMGTCRVNEIASFETAVAGGHSFM